MGYFAVDDVLGVAKGKNLSIPFVSRPEPDSPPRRCSLPPSPLIYRSVRFVVPLSFRFSFFFLPRETTIISKRIDSRVEATEQLLSALGRFEASTRKQSQEGEKDSS